MLGYTIEDYLIISSNPILNKNIDDLRDVLKTVNSLNRDGLKTIFKIARSRNRFTMVGGAGIGLIDMARKSGEKLEYEFREINNDVSIYSLMVRIPRTVKQENNKLK